MSTHVDDLIKASMARGEMDDLPGRGKPLDLDDDRAVPAELRMTYRILKGANMVPAEVQEMKALRALQDELASATDPDETARLTREVLRRQALLKAHLEKMPRR